MINSIKSFFESKLAKTKEAEQEAELVQKVDLACAALLIEVMNSDHELDERESAEFIAVLKNTLNVDEEDINEIIKLAEDEARKATSLYEFTRLINDGFDYPQKLTLIENMWRIAFSDEKLDRYEDHLIRKVSELIYVSHSDFIKAKLQVRS
ncbi:MAG: TerB family tellurite resistance protein [Gammaproteobacteria bacterium]|jgi:uncharacterized tellurite resistance protein B-like protein|nr:hypothetical protein [Gammaproteobacteria bacterium]MDP6097855.1 TerB family tellurite resistance protein [Gammaproteobacteria bacterium]HJO11026.1 TerB family tellurite resistance protein [Gammaproteobacteria bacterium]|tara:strand:- start:911 stop:1366 length:456 start_codon:yes stop_codon:yes gene_type:complete